MRTSSGSSYMFVLVIVIVLLVALVGYTELQGKPQALVAIPNIYPIVVTTTVPLTGVVSGHAATAGDSVHIFLLPRTYTGATNFSTFEALTRGEGGVAAFDAGVAAYDGVLWSVPLTNFTGSIEPATYKAFVFEIPQGDRVIMDGGKAWHYETAPTLLGWALVTITE